MFRYIFSIVIIFCVSTQVFSQKEEEKADIAAIVNLDSFVVTATRQGFSVEDFVTMVQEDESFYKAFRQIRFLSYKSNNDIKMFDTKNKVKASYKNLIFQQSDGKCRTMDVLDETIEGKYFKGKNKHKYYTGKLHDRLFLTHGTQCENANVGINTIEGKGKIEKYVAELKKLIFSPGKEADIPLIGKKTAIFSKKMAKYYDYKITSQIYNGGMDCYVFTASVKPQYQDNPSRTVIKHLDTYFDKSNFQVVAREYRLAYSATVYDFDVTMKIELIKHGDVYVPSIVQYDGQWDIPARKPEISKFTIDFFEYQ